jgi:hypothetical protein
MRISHQHRALDAAETAGMNLVATFENLERNTFDYVVVYGAFFSLLLAAGYLPVHRVMNSKARELSRAMNPVPDRKPEDWKAWRENADAFADYLGLGLTRLPGIRLLLTVLTPVAAGFLTGLLGFK